MQIRNARQLLSMTIFLCFVYTFLLAIIQMSLDLEAPQQTTPRIEWAEVNDRMEESRDVTQGIRTAQQQIDHKSMREIDTKLSENSLRKTPSFPIKDNITNSSKETGTAKHQALESVLLRKLKENRDAHSNLKLNSTHQNISSQNTPPEEKVEFLQLSPNFYIYKGFLDKRGDEPRVRLMVLRSSSKIKRSLVCVFNTTMTPTGKHNDSVQGITEHEVPGYVPQSNTNTFHRSTATEYEMCENHDKKYGGWIYSCALPNGVVATSLKAVTVSLHKTETGEMLTTLSNIPLQHVDKSPKKLQSQRLKSELSGSFDGRETHHKVKHLPVQLTNQNQSRHDNPINTQNTQPTKHNLHKSKKFPLGKATKIGTNHKIGVCVPPLYGDINLQRIVNFAEFCKILGASRIILYVNDLSPDILPFLHEYSKMEESIVSIVNWTLPVIDKSKLGQHTRYNQPPQSPPIPSWELPPSQIVWNRGQLMAVQHCLYSHMSSFDWMLFLDIDEMLIPKTSPSWQGLIDDVMTKYNLQERKNSQHKNDKSASKHQLKINQNGTQYTANSQTTDNLAAFSFESAIFQTHPESQAIYSMDYFQKTKRSKKTDKHRRKVIVRPRRIYEMGIHHVSRVLDELDTVQNVLADDALVHHYRDGDVDVFSEWQDGDKYVLDGSVLPYREQLYDANRIVMGYLAGVMAEQQKHRDNFTVESG